MGAALGPVPRLLPGPGSGGDDAPHVRPPHRRKGSDLYGLLAVNERDEATGFAHCVVHPTTWSREPSCYLEDLFVSRPERGTDLGRTPLQEAKRLSVERGADRLYWHTQEYNGPARSLYDQVGRLTSFVV
jgi:GNAT superfamily N-acetyltransferase